MKVTAIQSNELNAASWSGGTTKELFIWPYGSSYKEMNFSFRLSLATIEERESVFTPLHGIKRTFVLLEGKVEFSGDQLQKAINPMESLQFDGGQLLHCFGTGKAFNLMTIGSSPAKLTQLNLKANSTHYTEAEAIDKLIVFIIKGELEIEGNIYGKNELIVIENLEKSLLLKTIKDCDILLIKIIK